MNLWKLKSPTGQEIKIPYRMYVYATYTCTCQLHVQCKNAGHFDNQIKERQPENSQIIKK